MRKAFTLVELLVVISIISLLIALAIPAVQAARESARRARCLSNQRNIAVALISYENHNKKLPGWRDLITISSQQGQNGEDIAAQASWVFCILPQMEETGLYDLLKRREFPSDVLVSPAVLNCPSHVATPENCATNYTVNAGAVDNFQDDQSDMVDVKTANGPFLDRAGIQAGNGVYSNERRFEGAARFEDISQMDGTSFTLMTSENTKRGFWISEEIVHFYHDASGNPITDVPFQTVSNTDNRLTTALTGIEDTIEGSLGFCWFRTYNNSDNPRYIYPNQKDPNNSKLGFLGTCLCGGDHCADPRGDFVFNHQFYDASRMPCFFNMFRQKTFQSWYQSARPASNHPGNVVVSFCDGNVRSLSELIDEKVFVHMMTAGTNESDAGKRTGGNFLEGSLLDQRLFQ